MKIAFWAPFGGAGATANMLAVSIAIADREESGVLMTETGDGTRYSGLMQGKAKSRNYVSDESGIDGVIRYFKAGMVTRQIMENCTIDLAGRLSLLTGTGPGTRLSTDSDNLRRMVSKIIDIAQDYYDFVMIDTDSGYSQTSLSTLADADIVVVNLRQNKHMLDALFHNEDFLKLDESKLFYLFGSYDPNSKYNLGNLRRMYRHINHSNSGGLPHCTTYMDALCDSRAIKYFSVNMVAQEYGEREFFKALDDAVTKITALARRTGRELVATN